ECRIVLFMFHDRVTFGGVLVALGLLYLWLERVPLRAGKDWAWWTLTVSATAGFASFSTYLATGYLDTWHGMATLCLLPLFVVGLARSRALVAAARSRDGPGRPGTGPSRRTREGLGRALLLVTGVGQAAAGATISVVGMTRVFVPQDLAFIGLG